MDIVHSPEDLVDGIIVEAGHRRLAIRDGATLRRPPKCCLLLPAKALRQDAHGRLT
jgi:hypothetical protein